MDKIFVPDPELRITLEKMKEHPVFSNFDFTVSMKDRYTNSMAPFIPAEAVFNEQPQRNSEQMQEAKPKNLLAAIMGNPGDNAGEAPKKDLNFDEAHYNKFDRENKDDDGPKRKRQNPLGDFKFVKINELF